MSGNASGKKFYTSDLHWFHNKICSFTHRPWSQEENDEKLIELWNSQVGAGDIVYHLGDMFFVKSKPAGIEKAVSIIERLNGNIFCILGNHDSSRVFDELQRRFRNKIIGVERLKETNIDNGEKKQKLVMCHYPLMSWNRSHYGTYHIFGHHHGSIHHQGKAVDVGLDGSLERLGEHRFWTTDDLFEYMKDREIYKPDGDHHKIKEN